MRSRQDASHRSFLIYDDHRRYWLSNVDGRFTEPTPALDVNKLSPKEVLQRAESLVASAREDMQAAIHRATTPLITSLNEANRKIQALEKMAQQHSFNPRVERAMREKIDYTQWRDEEDNMTDEDRGIPPPPKERTVF
jgi:hypothetical protein